MSVDKNKQKEFLEVTRELLINKEITKEDLGIKKYCFFNSLLFSKVKDCNMIYNPKIENSKCNNSYFKSIIDDVNDKNRQKSIYDINDLKDHILYLKQSGTVDIKIKNNSINIIPKNPDNKELLIYPVKRRNNYHLFHGTSIANAKKIMKDGYINATKILKSLVAYDKVFLSNSTKYSALYGMYSANNHLKTYWNETSEDINEYSIIFQINTSKYDVYHYCTYVLDCEEYFIWDSISIEDVEKIYLMKYCEIVKELDLNQLF